MCNYCTTYLNNPTSFELEGEMNMGEKE